MNIYDQITDKIIASLEKGVAPWRQPWVAGGDVSLPRRSTGEHYSGVNVLVLWCEAAEKGYTSSYWFTFNQARALKGCVRKGEKGTMVVYANRFVKTETNDNGDDVEKVIPFLRQYTVFCADQIDGLPAEFYARPPKEHTTPMKDFLAATGAEVRTGGGRAFYAPDFITMPALAYFEDEAAYDAVLAHELVHWTKDAARLNRDFGRKHWGDEAYACEELVAELGSAFLCADLGLTPDTREDHARYIANWLTVLKKDKRAIFTAASHASKAVAYLHSLQANIKIDIESVL